MTDELSQEARSLIRAALADEPRPGSSHRDLLRRRVLARAATGGVVTLVGSSVAKASARSLFSIVTGGLGIGFGTGLVLLGAVQLVSSPSASVAFQRPVAAAPARAPAAASSVPRATPEAPVASRAVAPFEAEPMPGAASPAVKPRAFEAPPRAEASAGSALRAELDLMAQVQEALRDAHGARALELIARYDARHPSGVLETERLAAEVFAACQIGDSARARRVAEYFLARDSRSALAVRVKNACLSAK